MGDSTTVVESLNETMLSVKTLNPDLNNDGKIEPWELDVYERLKAADTDMDGNLTRAELYYVIKNASEQIKNGIPISSLNPDTDGDGQVEAWEQEVYGRIVAADTDNSGAISVRNLFDFIRKMSMEVKEASKGGIPIASLDPDTDGDGKVEKWEMDVFGRIKKADEDGSGSISVKELFGVIKGAAESDRQKKMAIKALGVAFLVIVFMLVSNLLLVLLANNLTAALAKPTNAATAALMSATTGGAAKTGAMNSPVSPVAARMRRLRRLDGTSYVTQAQMSSTVGAALVADQGTAQQEDLTLNIVTTDNTVVAPPTTYAPPSYAPPSPPWWHMPPSPPPPSYPPWPPMPIYSPIPPMPNYAYPPWPPASPYYPANMQWPDWPPYPPAPPLPPDYPIVYASPDPVASPEPWSPMPPMPSPPPPFYMPPYPPLPPAAPEVSGSVDPSSSASSSQTFINTKFSSVQRRNVDEVTTRRQLAERVKRELRATDGMYTSASRAIAASSRRLKAVVMGDDATADELVHDLTPEEATIIRDRLVAAGMIITDLPKPSEARRLAEIAAAPISAPEGEGAPPALEENAAASPTSDVLDKLAPKEGGRKLNHPSPEDAYAGYVAPYCTTNCFCNIAPSDLIYGSYEDCKEGPAMHGPFACMVYTGFVMFMDHSPVCPSPPPPSPPPPSPVYRYPPTVLPSPEPEPVCGSAGCVVKNPAYVEPSPGAETTSTTPEYITMPSPPPPPASPPDTYERDYAAYAETTNVTSTVFTVVDTTPAAAARRVRRKLMFMPPVGDSEYMATEYTVVVPDDGPATFMTVPMPAMRELSVSEGHAMRRRHLEQINMHEDMDSSSVDFPGCVVYHCFKGDEGCEDPSPFEACMRVADDGSCVDPLCKHYIPEE